MWRHAGSRWAARRRPSARRLGHSPRETPQVNAGGCPRLQPGAGGCRRRDAGKPDAAPGAATGCGHYNDGDHKHDAQRQARARKPDRAPREPRSPWAHRIAVQRRRPDCAAPPPPANQHPAPSPGHRPYSNRQRRCSRQRRRRYPRAPPKMMVITGRAASKIPAALADADGLPRCEPLGNARAARDGVAAASRASQASRDTSNPGEGP